MSQTCLHAELLVHAFVELQVPHYLKDGEIDYSDIDDTPVIRPDMGVTCLLCKELDVHYEDWREAPEEHRALFLKVREDMEDKQGYIEGYPLNAITIKTK